MSGYIQSIQRLLNNSAPIAADELTIPGEEEIAENAVRNQDVGELLIRLDNAEARFIAVDDAIDEFFANEIAPDDVVGHTFTFGQVDTMRTLLDEASFFGVPGTTSGYVVSYGDEVGKNLLSALDGASKAMKVRRSEANKQMIAARDGAKLNDVRITALLEAAREVFGKSFRVWPHFTPRNITDIETQLALPKSDGILRNAGMMAMEGWQHGLSNVRKRVSTWDTLQMYAENFGVALPEMTPAQLPFSLDEGGVATDYWLGLEFPDGYFPEQDKLSLVMMNSQKLTTAPTETKMGLLIDEWLEIIPSLQETTAVAFNYDQPDAKAPNNLMLAVTPKETGSWDWDDLVVTMLDTLHLAKNRAVEPEHLEDTVFGQILPGILTEIVPPQLQPDGQEGQSNPLGLQVVTDFGINNTTVETGDE
jgi:hypothetical protein